MQHSWKIISVLVALVVVLFSSSFKTMAEPSLEPTGSSVSAEATEPTQIPYEPFPSIPEAAAPSEAPTESEITETPEESDIITDIEVKLYNDCKKGFNYTDGSVYCRDIAALLLKHAPKGLRISVGCAMAYTEGGAGKQWGVYARTNNCFGIRATKNWDGWVYSRKTGVVYKDYDTAIAYGASDFFRAYPTMEDSVKDYIRHMQNSRYGKVLTMTNDYDYCHYIINQGYGPEHLADDWVYLIKYYKLNQYDLDWSLE